MNAETSPILTTLAMDHHNSGEIQGALRHHELWPLVDAVPAVSKQLKSAISGWVGESGTDPFPVVGGDSFDLGFLLRVFMHQSADMQYLYASHHLLRGHGGEIHGHLRTMIENAGVAYRSREDPKLGELYISGQIREFRKRTPSGRILPPDDPLTERLNGLFAYCSKNIHSNFLSMYDRTKTDLSREGDRGHLQHVVRFQDVDPNDLVTLLRPALVLISVGVEALNVIAHGFQLPAEHPWFQDLGKLDAGRRACRDRYADILLDGLDEEDTTEPDRAS